MLLNPEIFLPSLTQSSPQGEGSPTPTVMFTAEHYLSEVADRVRAVRKGEGVVSTRKNFLSVSEADEGKTNFKL